MSLVNATTYPCLDVPYLDRHGREVVIVIVKGTFVVDAQGRVRPAPEPVPVRAGDVPYDPESPMGSARYPSDVCDEKRGTDVVLVGDAVAEKPVTALDVGVKIREVTVPLRVHGPRLFYRGVAGVAIGPSAAFERVPLVYERAYGGVTADFGVMEERNPAGVGVHRREADLVDKPAPQIEHPARPHTRASDKHPPVGFGAIMSHWSPRRDHAGTFDAVWKETRMPLMPLDFDVRYNNVAHPSLIFEEPLVPGDVIAVTGMSAPKALVFALPALPLVIRGVYDRTPPLAVRPPIDTVIVEPDRRRFEIVCRATFPLGRGKNQLREARIDVDT